MGTTIKIAVMNDLNKNSYFRTIYDDGSNKTSKFISETENMVEFVRWFSESEVKNKLSEDYPESTKLL